MQGAWRGESIPIVVLPEHTHAFADEPAAAHLLQWSRITPPPVAVAMDGVLTPWTAHGGGCARRTSPCGLRLNGRRARSKRDRGGAERSIAGAHARAFTMAPSQHPQDQAARRPAACPPFVGLHARQLKRPGAPHRKGVRARGGLRMSRLTLFGSDKTSSLVGPLLNQGVLLPTSKPRSPAASQLPLRLDSQYAAVGVLSTRCKGTNRGGSKEGDRILALYKVYIKTSESYWKGIFVPTGDSRSAQTSGHPGRFPSRKV